MKTFTTMLAAMLLLSSCATTSSRSWYPSGQMSSESQSTTVVGTIDSALATVIAIPFVVVFGTVMLLQAGTSRHPYYYDTYCRPTGRLPYNYYYTCPGH